jgi:hypothetical protein
VTTAVDFIDARLRGFNFNIFAVSHVKPEELVPLEMHKIIHGHNGIPGLGQQWHHNKRKITLSKQKI